MKSRAGDHRQPSTEIDSCDLCGGILRRLRDFPDTGNEASGLFRCVDCGLESVWPQPDDARLAEVYARYPDARRDRTGPTAPAELEDGRHGQGGVGKRAYFRALLSSLSLQLDGCEILDVGAAEGDAAAAALDLWSESRVTALEPGPMSETTGAADEPRLIRASGTLETWLRAPSQRKYDAILAFDVIEHLRTPGDTVTRLIHDRLAEEGRFVATFPNADSLTRRLMGRHWMQYKSEHLHYYSAASVERLARRAGLETRLLAPLTKRLPTAYFLSVAAAFGPPTLRRLADWAATATPSALMRRSLSMRTGEWLWLARKRIPAPPND